MPGDDENTERSGRLESHDSHDSESITSGPTLTPSLRISGPLDTVLPPLDEKRYRLDSGEGALLGKGGQGTVWKAYDVVLHREVALKRLHPQLMKDPALVASFLREARLTASLQHAGIVPLHDVGQTSDGVAAIVMRRMEGESLADIITRKKTLEQRLPLVPALLRASQAVAYAHERHVVHRDLKPQNIMLGKLGETAVLDWGLALVKQSGRSEPVTTASHESSGVVGTPAYMSPEQALGLEADEKSDVWGLGACLYQLLTGQPPIVGRSLQSALGHAAAAEVSPVLAIEPNVPEDLAAICAKCLQPERAERYPSAVAVARDLERWLAGRTVSARRYSAAELVRRAVRANRVMVTGLAVVFVAVSSLLVVNELRVRRERNEARQFAQDLLREVPERLDTEAHNVALATFLSERANAWLARSDLTSGELAAVCDALVRLSTFHIDIGQREKARDLARQAQRLSSENAARFGRDVDALVCSTSVNIHLGLLDLETAPDAGVAYFELAMRDLDSYRGPENVDLETNRVWLSEIWGTWMWERGEQRGLDLLAHSFDVGRALMPKAKGIRRQQLFTTASNGLLAVWLLRGRRAAFDAAKEGYALQEEFCSNEDAMSLRACYVVISWYSMISAWEGAPETKELRRKTREVEEKVLRRDPESAAYRFDTTCSAVESNDFATAAERAIGLREVEPSFAADIGPIALYGANRFDDLNAWARTMPVGSSGGALGYGLGALTEGRYADAAQYLSKVEGGRALYLGMSWPPDFVAPRPVPEAIRPDFERFLVDFKAALGVPNFDGVTAAVRRLQHACEAQAPR